MGTAIWTCAPFLTVVLAAPAASSSQSDLNHDEFLHEFSAALEDDDLDRAEQLVHEHPGRVLELFQQWSRRWILVRGDPTSDDLLALEHARFLAEAVDGALDAPGLFEQYETLDGLSAGNRERLRETVTRVEEALRSQPGGNRSSVTRELTEYAKELEQAGLLTESARAWYQLGMIASAERDPTAAAQHQRRALGLYRQFGDPGATLRCLDRLALAHLNLGQFEQAMGCYEQAIELEEHFDDPVRAAIRLNDLGICNTGLLQFERAIERFHESLALWEALGNRTRIRTSLNNLGSCAHDLGRFEEALSYHQRSHELAKESGDPVAIATAHQNLSGDHAALKRFKAAIDHGTRSLAIWKQLGHRADVAAMLNNLGMFHECLDEYETALDYHGRALALNRTLGNPEIIANNLNAQGYCHERMGNVAEALRLWRRSFEYLNRVPLRSLSPAEQARFSERYEVRLSRALEAALRLSPEAPEIQDAYWITESMRCRSLMVELAARADGSLARALTSSDPDQDRLLAKLERTRLALATAFHTPGRELGPLQRELERLERQQAESWGALRRRDPRLMELAMPEPADVTAIRRAVLGPEHALLHYVLVKDQAYLWLMTTDHLSLHALSDAPPLKEKVDALTSKLATHTTNSGGFISDARELFHQLLGPVHAEITGRPELILITDGFLGSLPYEVLLTKDPGDAAVREPAYLLRDHTVTYAPSSSYLVFHTSERPNRERWDKEALLIGDALYGAEIGGAEVHRAVPTPREIARLRGTRTEVLCIAQQLNDEQESTSELLADLSSGRERSGSVAGRRFDLHVGAEAREARLREDLTGYRILHLATHGHFDPDHPWFTGLVLSGSGSDSGFLNLLELGRLQIEAELVFLSACETGSGERLQGEGIQSTARSFLVAGAGSVIATQWKVADDAAATLAVEFYRLLFQRVPARTALRQAKLSMIEGRVAESSIHTPQARGVTAKDVATPIQRLAHPSAWAPFVLYGHARN